MKINLQKIRKTSILISVFSESLVGKPNRELLFLDCSFIIKICNLINLIMIFLNWNFLNFKILSEEK